MGEYYYYYIYYIYISPLIISYFYIKIKLNKKKRDSASITENKYIFIYIMITMRKNEGERRWNRSTALSQFAPFAQSSLFLQFFSVFPIILIILYKSNIIIYLFITHFNFLSDIFYHTFMFNSTFQSTINNSKINFI